MIDKNDLENNLNRVHEWIRAADQKVSILFALEGIIITLMVSDSVDLIQTNFQYGCWSSVILYIAGFVLLLVSAYKAALAIVPRLSRRKNGKSLLYFGDVASMDLKSFEENMKGLSAQDYENQLLEQIHISSVIATSKHKHFRDSIVAFLVSISLLVITYLIWYLPYGY